MITYLNQCAEILYFCYIHCLVMTVDEQYYLQWYQIVKMLILMPIS